MNFVNMNGIIFEHTIPNNPQQNGRVEQSSWNFIT